VLDRALFGNLDNLDVNVDDPYGKYVPPNGLLSTVDSGQWYNSAYRHKAKDPSKDFMMPIIFACDETHLRKGGKASSWPLLFTTSILNQKTHNLPIAWRTLGHINNMSLLQSATEDKNLSKEVKAERLHAIFKTIMACGSENIKSATTITDIKPRIIHIVLIEIIKNILSVVLYQSHYSDHINFLALNQGIA
jgi:hypothetical protein